MTASTLSVREALGNWLSEVFGTSTASLLTLTFAPRLWERDALGKTGPTRSRVMRAGYRFEKLLTRSVAKPSFFIVMERGGWNGRAHLHCLLSSVDPVVIRAARALHAREGFTNEKREVHPIATATYVAKYVTKADGDWWRAGGPLFGVHPLDALGSGSVFVGLPREARYVTDVGGRYL